MTFTEQEKQQVFDNLNHLVEIFQRIEGKIEKLLPDETTIPDEIVHIERGETRSSHSPMWRCVTAAGRNVNIFAHSDPLRDNSHLFQDRGYMLILASMMMGYHQDWTGRPIPIRVQQDGAFWKIVAVEHGGLPDAPAYDPDALDGFEADASEYPPLNDVRADAWGMEGEHGDN